MRAFIVVRRHQEQSVRPRLLGILREMNGVGCVVGTGSGDDRDTAPDGLHRELDGRLMLGIVHGGCFASGSSHDDSVCTVVDLMVNHPPKFREIDFIRREGRDNGHPCAAKNELLHRNLLSVLTIPPRPKETGQKRHLRRLSK